MIQARNIDLDTFPYRALGGVTGSKTCAAATYTQFEIQLPNSVPSTNYYVVATLSSGGAGWGDGFMWKVLSKTTSSFKIEVWNPQGTAVTGIAFNWIMLYETS